MEESERDGYRIYLQYNDEPAEYVRVERVREYLDLKKNNPYTYQWVLDNLAPSEVEVTKVFRCVDPNQVEFERVMTKDEQTGEIIYGQCTVPNHQTEEINLYPELEQNSNDFGVENLSDIIISAPILLVETNQTVTSDAITETPILQVKTNQIGTSPNKKKLEFVSHALTSKQKTCSKAKSLKTSSKKLPDSLENNPQNSLTPVYQFLKYTSPKKKGKQVSLIWEHAQKTKNGIKCNYCGATLIDHKNTSNMDKHLRTLHPLYYPSDALKKKENVLLSNPSNNDALNQKKMSEKIICKNDIAANKSIGNTSEQNKKRKIEETFLGQKNGTIIHAFKKQNDFKIGNAAHESITYAVQYMICKDLLPLNTVEKDGFRTLMNLIVPLYKVPSRSNITTRIEATYKNLNSKVCREFENLEYFCITADKWTDNAKKNYMGITTHYNNKSSVFKSRVVGCIPLSGSQTTNHIVDELHDILNKHKLDVNKITAFVTDGEPAIVSAAQILVGVEKHLTCAAHLMSHVVPDSIQLGSELDVIIKKIKSITSFIRHSTPATEKLESLQKTSEDSSGSLRCKQDCETRWSSTTEMLNRYYELQQFIYLTLTSFKYDPNQLLTPQETTILEDVLPIFNFINHFLKEVSGEEYTTVSLIIAMIDLIKDEIMEHSTTTTVGKEFKISVLSQIKKRFADIEKKSIYSHATILDPRFKRDYFKDPHNMTKALNQINLEVKNLVREDQPVNIERAEDTNKNGEKNIWYRRKQKLQHNKSKTADSGFDYTLELKQYLALPVSENIHADIFQYWTGAQSTFPSLSKIALKKLSILSTSVPSERIFSRAELIKDDSRNRLSGNHLNILLFLSCLNKEDWGI